MEEFANPQIREGIKLALPDGLKELMADISREVLREQPEDLCTFIADYLGALLVSREHLNVSSKICDSVCAGACYPAVQEQLKELGLVDEDIGTATDIINQHVHMESVNEENLLDTLIEHVNINEKQLPGIQKVVRNAFLQVASGREHTHVMPLSEHSNDPVTRAVNHTLNLYQRTRPSEAEYEKMATRIQNAYRAYGVRRNRQSTESDNEIKTDRTLRFQIQEPCFKPGAKDVRSGSINREGCVPRYSSCSSVSLAGSFINLPKYKPYTIHNRVLGVNEVEQVHGCVDYTAGDHEGSILDMKRVKMNFDLESSPNETHIIGEIKSDSDTEDTVCTENSTHVNSTVSNTPERAHKVHLKNKAELATERILKEGTSKNEVISNEYKTSSNITSVTRDTVDELSENKSSKSKGTSHVHIILADEKNSVSKISTIGSHDESSILDEKKSHCNISIDNVNETELHGKAWTEDVTDIEVIHAVTENQAVEEEAHGNVDFEHEVTPEAITSNNSDDE